MPARFDLLILDLDGTLVDSETILVGLVNETLVVHGHAAAPPREVAASIGLPLHEVFRRVLPDVGAAAIEPLCASYRRRANAPEFVRQFRLYPGVKATLSALRDAGTRLVIATSKGRATTVDILRHCQIYETVDEVIGGDCVSRGKPHPEMVERARQLFPAVAARTVMIGDTSYDIEMGQAAGVATCAATYGMHAAASLQALRPSFLIERFEQLRPIVLGQT
jgi:phosphoglycolate phosphatase